MRNFKFTKGVESLINPINIGTLHFLAQLNDKLPKQIQNKLINNASTKNPLMGFIVEPYCFFLCHEITDKSIFKESLPDNFELTKSKIFDDDDEKYYFILSCFNAKTSAFFGNRVEAYVIAKDLNTQLVSWVIVDYDTNTISYDSKNGLTQPSCDTGIITTDFSGQVIVDMERKDGSRHLKFNSSLNNAKLKKLDYKLWIEGNLSVAYGKKLSDTGDVFSLRFNPQEMNEAYEVDLDQLELTKNNWYSEYIKETPTKLVCFPYAQHFLSDAPGHSSNLKNEQELLENINNFSFKNTKVYSSESIKVILILPIFLTIIIIICLLALLLFTNI